MSEHTRTTRDVEFFFVAGMTTAGTRPHIARAEFRDYLAAHDAQVKAEALREAADRIDLTMAYRYDDSEYRNAEAAAEIWLRLEADRIAPKGNETWAT